MRPNVHDVYRLGDSLIHIRSIIKDKVFYYKYGINEGPIVCDINTYHWRDDGIAVLSKEYNIKKLLDKIDEGSV